MSARAALSVVGGVVLLAGATLAARRAQLRWGATDDEVAAGLPGDEYVAAADLIATRAIGIDAPAESVWPWVAQIGQERGGFYSYDRLENLAGCQMQSADAIVDAWQQVSVGQAVRLHPDVALRVVAVDPPHALVLRPWTQSDGLEDETPADPIDELYDFCWAFVVQAVGPSRSRLVVRERYAGRTALGRALVEPLTAVSFVMTERMLRGVRDRAEGASPAGASQSEGTAPGRA